MRALSIRQPYVELILRGIKTVEYRSRPTRIVGERFHLYATKQLAAFRPSATPKPWSTDLGMPGGALPAWMLELAAQVRLIEPEAEAGLLPRGLIVGSAVIERVSQTADGMFRWHLAEVERATVLREPQRHPQPSWFQPF